MEHTDKKNLRKYDITINGILQVNDNLNEQLESFLISAAASLETNFFPAVKN